MSGLVDNILIFDCDAFLLGKHTIFGRVLSGMKVLQRIGLVDTDSNDR